MDAETLCFALLEAGVSIDVVDGRLVAWPSERVPPSLVVPLREHAGELVRRLEGRPSAERKMLEITAREEGHCDTPNPHLTGRWSRWGDLIACPLCQAQDLAESIDGLECRSCGRLAWRAESNSIIRVDYDTEKRGLGAVSFPLEPSVPETHWRRCEAEVARQDRRQQERLRSVQAAASSESGRLFPETRQVAPGRS